MNLLKCLINNNMDCNNPFIFYTTWYNIVLYLLLLSKVSNVAMKTYLIFAVPIFIIGEYILWFMELWKKCKFTFYKALFISISGHWIPLFLYFKHNNVHGLSTTVLFLVSILTIMYTMYFNVNIPSTYGLGKPHTEYLHH